MIDIVEKIVEYYSCLAKGSFEQILMHHLNKNKSATIALYFHLAFVAASVHVDIVTVILLV